MRYGFIAERRERWPAGAQCRVLGVSESGFYRYLKNLGRPGRDELLSAAIREILEEHPLNDNYGVNRMQLALAQRGTTSGVRRLRRIMWENGWLHERKRRPKGLTKASSETMLVENLIRQDFSADKPCQKLLTDITQIQCADGKLYISPILDCFNGEIIALSMDGNMKKELCVNTVKAAAGRYALRGAILHSDRGSQYTSAAFRQVLEKHGLRQSLSGVGHCYDNARMESFFATLKKELVYRVPTYRMKREEMKALIFRYVFVYYNRLRVYTANQGGLPPALCRRPSQCPAA